MEWISGFIVPLVSMIFVVGIVGFFLFYLFKGLHNAWSKAWKFTIKYSIFRRKYPKTTVKWILECIEKGIGYYDAKKLLTIKGISQKRINETMWIFDKVITQLNKQGGNNGRKFKGCNRNAETTEGTELPTI